MDGNTVVNVVDQGDLAQAVREAAMLADVTISMWSAERSDRDLLDKLKADTGAQGNVGRVVKNLLAGADQKLKDAQAAFRAVRTLHYGLTLPWVSDPHAERQRGPRLLPHLLFEQYLSTLSKQKREALNKLDEFLDAYPVLVAQAQVNLGGMADAVYPSVDEVRAAFRVGFDFEPIPAGASFKGLPPQVIDRLAKGLHAKQQRMIEGAQQAMWTEARERVAHIAERLADTEAKFKASTVENVRELITLLPGWNLTGQPEVAEAVEDIKRMLAGVDAKTLRDDARVRQDTASKASALVGKLNQWGV